MKTKSKKSAAPKVKAATASTSVGDTSGSEADYLRFLPMAERLADRDVVPFRADAMLAYHNVDVMVSSLDEVRNRLSGELPGLDISALDTMRNLALAVVFAAAQVDRGGGAVVGLGKSLATARTLREVMISSADALAKSGLVPAREVAKIHEGSGAIDMAQDCVDLARLFRAHAAKIRGKHAVSADQIKQASDVGTTLLQQLKPGRAKSGPKGGSAAVEASNVRDRLWTLLVRDAEQARRAGVWIWGEEHVDNKVPHIQAGRQATKKKAAASAPAASKSA